MVYYYLDIETYSPGQKPDPSTDTILTISFCAVDPGSGEQLQPPVILKAWDSSEETIVKELARRMFGASVFDFVPVGFDVLFDLWFLKHKFKQYGVSDLGDKFYLDRPFLDLKHIAVIANKGRFKGVKLTSSGNPVKEWYETREFHKIESYTIEKIGKLLSAYSVWAKRLKE